MGLPRAQQLGSADAAAGSEITGGWAAALNVSQAAGRGKPRVSVTTLGGPLRADTV